MTDIKSFSINPSAPWRKHFSLKVTGKKSGHFLSSIALYTSPCIFHLRHLGDGMIGCSINFYKKQDYLSVDNLALSHNLHARFSNLIDSLGPLETLGGRRAYATLVNGISNELPSVMEKIRTDYMSIDGVDSEKRIIVLTEAILSSLASVIERQLITANLLQQESHRPMAKM